MEFGLLALVLIVIGSVVTVISRFIKSKIKPRERKKNFFDKIGLSDRYDDLVTFGESIEKVNLEMLKGTYVVLIIVCLLGFGYSIFNYVYNVKHISYDEAVSDFNKYSVTLEQFCSENKFDIIDSKIYETAEIYKREFEISSNDCTFNVWFNYDLTEKTKMLAIIFVATDKDDGLEEIINDIPQNRTVLLFNKFSRTDTYKSVFSDFLQEFNLNESYIDDETDEYTAYSFSDNHDYVNIIYIDNKYKNDILTFQGYMD